METESPPRAGTAPGAVAEPIPRKPAAPLSTLVLLGSLVVGGLALLPWLAFGRSAANDWLFETWRWAALAGAVVIVGGGLLYALLPAVSRVEAAAVRSLWGTHEAVLLDLLAVVVLAAPLSALGVAAVNWLTGSPVASFDEGQLRLRPEGILVGIVLTDLPMVLMLWARVVRPGASTWDGLGWRWRGWRDVRLGFGVWVAVLLTMASVGAVLRAGGFVSEQMQQFAIQGATPDRLALALLGGAVFAPLVEELFFRGYVLGAYAARKGAVRGVLYSAALFAVVHLNPAARAQNPAESLGPAVALFVPIALTGLILAAVRLRAGSLVPGIVAHALNNAAAFAVLFAGPPLPR